MNCIIDIGNTRVKIARFEANELIEVQSFSEQIEISKYIRNFQFDHSIVSSVADEELTKFVNSLFRDPIVLDLSTPIPIVNTYKTPATLGKDRLANAVAANLLYSETNTLVIDAGTCLKFDFINKNSEYLGGSISPGMTMRLRRYTLSPINYR